ncbi:MAG: Asp-tRNA(Asn)/Glu-tRNA(Gln) amidotransferase subunit GatA [Chlamydiia bacterium]|nr:Asp-tRNA(Asn)/Glu-tRNA(Gln) amidotransferase subunit GatA [Chlamydiia bacterium]
MHELTAIQLHDRFIKGKATAKEIVRYFLDRIDTLNPKYGAFLSVCHERALQKAEALDAKKQRGEPLGKLAALPIAIKDNIHVKGELTTCASKFLTNYRAPFDATVTRLIEEADGIIVGKTNLDEFAMGSTTENSALQKTYNPWNVHCTPGGSSGGSCVAVATKMVPLSLGSDTGGSIRQPASFCGIVGFKPTYGRVSRFGLVAFGSSLDQIGPFATTAQDAALMMEVIGEHCEHDSTSLHEPADSYQFTPIPNLRIGVPEAFISDLEPENRARFEESLKMWEAAGATRVPVDLDILRYSIATYYILATAEASTNLARFDGIRYGQRSQEATTLDEIYDFSKQEGFGPEVKRRILLGTFVLSAGYQDAYYKKAQKVRTLIIKAYKNAFAQCDLICLPTTPRPAFPIGSIKDPLEMYLEDIYTIGVNLAGLPAASIPCGSIDNLPVGLQVLGPQKGDVKVLQGCHQFGQLYPTKLPKVAP